MDLSERAYVLLTSILYDSSCMIEYYIHFICYDMALKKSILCVYGSHRY